MSNSKILPHPTSTLAREDRLYDRENLARQLRTTQMMREQAREQINATEVISEILSIKSQLTPSEDLAGNMIPPDKDIVAALKAKADINFRLLAKVVPDLKATESISHTSHDHSHQHVHANVSDIELVQRLQLWRKSKSSSEATSTPAKSEPKPEFDWL